MYDSSVESRKSTQRGEYHIPLSKSQMLDSQFSRNPAPSPKFRKVFGKLGTCLFVKREVEFWWNFGVELFGSIN